MEKLSLLFSGAASLLALFGCSGAPDGFANRTDKPNFIVIVADDSSPMDYGCYGSAVARTPNIDSLATGGMLFTRGFVTASSCSPSRTSMLTGVYPSQLGLARNLHVELPAESGLTTLQRELSKAGYYTGISGKTHIGKYAISHFERVIPLIPKDQGGGSQGFVKLISERPKDKPFFFWLASTDPHRPFTAPEFAQQYNPATLPIPQFWADTPETREDLRQHYGEIARLDSYVGKVLAELERQGVLEDTLIIYIADNGRPFPRYKTTNYDSGTNVPFIAMWKGVIKAGKICAQPVSTIDIAPTFLELAGLEIPKQFEGTSFVKTLQNPKTPSREYVFTERNWHNFKGYERAVRDKKYSYIRNYLPDLQTLPPSDLIESPTFQAMWEKFKNGTLHAGAMHCFAQPRAAEEFYDLEDDPLETRNLALRPQYASLVKKYSDVLDAWMKSTGQAFDEGELVEDWTDRITLKPNSNRAKKILVPLKYLQD